MTKAALDLAGKTGPELVALYNEMVLTAVDLKLVEFGTTKRFASAEAAKTRINKLHAAIEAARGTPDSSSSHSIKLSELKGGDKLVEAVKQAQTEETAPASAEGEQAADSAAEAQDGETAPGEEEQDMAKKAKAKKAKAPSKMGRGARSRSTSGETIRELTEEYNNIVAKMNKGQKEAAPFARHHSSMFESKDKAKKQLARLKKAIA